jgi:uncharacterized protein YunC (DUF1805 family)
LTILAILTPVRFKEINIEQSKAGLRRAIGIEIPLPKAPLVLVIGKKGFLMCGYLDVGAAGRLGGAAAVIRGVQSVEELLEKPIVAVTPRAFRLGVRVGMPGHRALSKLL